MGITEKATFGGGCFWCIEAVVQRLQGVIHVESGYAGGTEDTANYRAVCSGSTRHAEVVQVTFDPSIISYEDLLSIFMINHDPTSLNRQGADAGPQYRSVIFYHNDEQKNTAEKVFENLGQAYSEPIVTELSPLEKFHSAEAYHQNYYNNNGAAGYCRMVIEPKVTKLKEQFADLIK